MGDSFNLKCHVMDFKVKSQLLPLLFSGGMAAAQAQTVLQQDTHMFREGDVILKQEVQYKSPGRSGKNVVWDFSELTPLENEYRESYDRMDSLFTCSGMMLLISIVFPAIHCYVSVISINYYRCVICFPN